MLVKHQNLDLMMILECILSVHWIQLQNKRFIYLLIFVIREENDRKKATIGMWWIMTAYKSKPSRQLLVYASI